MTFNLNKDNECTKFIFTQTTGLYDAIDNPNGWGIPNYELNQVLDSYITIKDLTSNTIYENIEVNASDNLESDIIYYDLIKLGQTISIQVENIQDGIYQFTHTVLIDNNDVLSATNYIMSLCKIECQLKQLSIKYINSTYECSECENKLLNIFVEAMSLYDVLKFTFKCGNFNDFNKILKNLQTLLLQLNCKNC